MSPVLTAIEFDPAIRIEQQKHVGDLYVGHSPQMDVVRPPDGYSLDIIDDPNLVFPDQIFERGESLFVLSHEPVDDKDGPIDCLALLHKHTGSVMVDIPKNASFEQRKFFMQKLLFLAGEMTIDNTVLRLRGTKSEFSGGFVRKANRQILQGETSKLNKSSFADCTVKERRRRLVKTAVRRAECLGRESVRALVTR